MWRRSLSALSPVSERVAELRLAFDEARAMPSSERAEEAENLLAIRISGDAYAIKVSEIAGLATGKKIVPVPGPIPELLGLAGIRGRLVPVYSLDALLGYDSEGEQPRWLALCGTEECFAVAFHEFEGYLHIAQAEIYPVGKKDEARIYVKEVARGPGAVRAVVSIALLRESIQESCRRNGVRKEL